MPNIIRTLLLFLFIPLDDVSAQESVISGRITNEPGQPVCNALITLYSSADSAIFRTGQSDTNGSFQLQQIPPANYFLGIQATGYKEAWQSVTVSGNRTLPDIRLAESKTSLKEVAITEKKKFVEQKIDRTVVNVDALISNAGTTVLDVLEKSPGVQVDQNGSISLKGRPGVMVYVDDRPTNLSGTALADYLRSLPSSTISQLELMTNPPAGYDAAGNAGIINIRTKRIKTKGFNGSLNLGYDQGIKTRTNNSLHLNYRHNKVNIYAILGYSHFANFNDLDIDRTFTDKNGAVRSYLKQNSDINYDGDNYTAKTGIDYYVSDKTTIGAIVSGVTRKGTQNNNNNGYQLNAAGALDSSVLARNEHENGFNNININMNGRHTFKSESKLSADLDYLVYNTDTRQLFNNTTYLPGNVLKASDILNGNLPAQIRIYSAKTDYTHPFKNNLKLDAGLKISYTKTDNIADYTQTIGGNTTPDYEKSNHFFYNETIGAAYVNGSKEFNRFSIQAGLRMEHTVSDGFQAGNAMKPDSSFNRTYTDLFPTVYMSYKVDSAGNHTLGLNYGKRISRPYYQDLNPFVSPLDKFTYYTGNPFLKPSYIHTTELSYNFKQLVTLSASYSKIKDNADETVEMINDVYYNRPGNVSDVDIMSLSLNGNYTFSKHISANLYAELTDIHSYGSFYTGKLDTRGTVWYVQPMLQFTFNKGWTAQMDGFYLSDKVFTQFISLSRWRMNASVAKKINSAATIRLTVNDIFYSQRNNGIINNLYQAEAYFRNRSDTRSVILTFSWQFGKSVSDNRRYNATGTEVEQNRVKG